MAVSDLRVVQARGGEVYTFTLNDDRTVTVRDNHLRTADWAAFTLPEGAVLSIAPVQHPAGDTLEVQFRDGSGVLYACFSHDDGESWSDPIRISP
jgi:hypothetical protein